MSEVAVVKEDAAKVEAQAVSWYHRVADWCVKYELYLVYVAGVVSAPSAKALWKAAWKVVHHG